ncbi:hypothetical protein, partial [Thiocystis minor]|uniref:hypothetical protein n=1 Tax=Thiocystis minor TaxID=61597 RepID=UPI003B82DC51
MRVLSRSFLLLWWFATTTLIQAQPLIRLINATSAPTPITAPERAPGLTPRTMVASNATGSIHAARHFGAITSSPFLQGTLWETVAARYGLDVGLLYGVALQETRHGVGAHASAPWPYTHPITHNSPCAGKIGLSIHVHWGSHGLGRRRISRDRSGRRAPR